MEEQPKPNIYSMIMRDVRSDICKAHKREYYDGLRAKIPEIIELGEKFAASTIAEKVGVSISFINWTLRKKDLEKQGATTLALKVYELSRLRDYQKNATMKPVSFRINALAKELGQSEKTIRKIVRDINLEQIIDDQIKEDIIDVVFSEEYYNLKTKGLNLKQLAEDVSTWPCIIKRFVKELNLKSYLKMAFKMAKQYNFPPQKIGLLLVYSDESTFKDRYNGYNHIGLARQIDWPVDLESLNTMMDILKHKDNVVK